MKGNDGRAARRLLWHRLFVVLMCFVGVLIVLNLFGIARNNRNSSPSRLPILRGRRSNSTHKKDISNINSGAPSIINVDIESDEQVLDKILSASIHLVNIIQTSPPESLNGDSYSGIYGDFCELNFALHKQDPSSVPMFRDLVGHSPDCESRYRVDLSKIATLARAFDNEDGALLGLTKNLQLGGVVFHESRCGSTLVANALIGMNPTKHRVYSESAPPIAALRNICGESLTKCNTIELASQVLQDTLYLMGRTNDLKEERVFFKIQSVGSRSLELFQTAMPGIPWMFVYRDPVQVLMSQLAQGSKNANCVRARQQPSQKVNEIIHTAGYKNAHQLTNEEYCAAHLASLTESAVAALERAPEMGVAVNYADLPDILYEDVLPNQWNIPVSQEEQENIQKISGVYSKGRGNRAGVWKEDSAKKEEQASAEIHKAADLFLRSSYDLLQGDANHNDAF